MTAPLLAPFAAAGEMTEDKLRRLRQQLGASTEPVAFDTETIGRSDDSGTVIFASWAAADMAADACSVLTPEGQGWLKSLCECKRPKIFHNAARADITFLRNSGYEVAGPIHDTLLMHTFIDEHHRQGHALKALSVELGNDRSDAEQLETIFQRFSRPLCNLQLWRSGSPIEKELFWRYAALDAADTLQLWQTFKPQLEANDWWELYEWEVEASLRYLKAGEIGILLDRRELDETYEQLQEPLRRLRGQLKEVFATEWKQCQQWNPKWCKQETFSPTAPQQLSAVLSFAFPIYKRTVTGRRAEKCKDRRYFKTSKDELEPFCTDERMQYVLAFKFLNRAQTTLRMWEKAADEHNRVHPRTRTTTATGRSAVEKPPVQQIPKRRGKITELEVGTKELATLCSNAFRRTRSVFTVPRTALFLNADYSQVEYRFMVVYSRSQRLIEQLRAGIDFHEATCKLVFGRYDKALREIIKIVNYGLLYGMGTALLTTRLQQFMPRHEIPALLERYESELPEMREFQQNIRRLGESQGFVRDIFNRRYRLEIDPKTKRPLSYKLVAYICQGSAANVKKRSFVRVSQLLEGHCSQPILDVHDQLGFELYEEDIDQVIPIVDIMQDFPTVPVPLVVSTEIGPNLLDQVELPNDRTKWKDFLHAQFKARRTV